MIFQRDPNPRIFPNIGNKKEDAYKYRNNLDIALKLGLEEFYRCAIFRNSNGKKLKIHPNVNFYIDVTTQCLYDCGFCIAKTTDGRSNQDEIKISYIKKAIEWINKLSIYYSCQITGGEPTLHSKFNMIHKMLPSTKTVVNTNNPIKDAFKYDHVNISCHHYNSKIEKEILGLERDRNKLKNQIMMNPRKVRLQCNLIGTYIDVFGEVMQYIAWAYHFMDVTNISFSFLTKLPQKTMYTDSIIDYVERRPADSFETIISEIEKSTHWKFLKYRGGVACYYEIWEYKAYEIPVIVQFKYSDNKYLDIIDKQDDYVPDFILHPNGVLTAGWDQRIKILADFRN